MSGAINEGDGLAGLLTRLREPISVRNPAPVNPDGPEAAARIEALEEELEHFIDIVDGTEETGFDPHVEQMLMDTAEAARALLSDSPQ